jgi:uncharacterized protein YjbJ (UPF0337 family)
VAARAGGEPGIIFCHFPGNLTVLDKGHVAAARRRAENKRTLMGRKGEFNKVVDKVKDTAENVKDAAGKAAHRGAAKAEQAKDTVKGDIDAMKRDVRKKT